MVSITSIEVLSENPRVKEAVRTWQVGLLAIIAAVVILSILGFLALALLSGCPAC